MKTETFTIRSFLDLEADIDISDDVCESLCIAFCGPMGLSEEGEKEFSEILNLKVIVFTHHDGYSSAVLNIDDENETVWKRRLKISKKLFEGMAGYCSEKDYDKWFIEKWAH